MRLEYELVEQSLPRYRQSQSTTCYQECSCRTVHKVTQCEGGTAGQCCSTMNSTIQSYREEPGQVMIKSRHKWNNRVQSSELRVLHQDISPFYEGMYPFMTGHSLPCWDVPFQDRMLPFRTGCSPKLMSIEQPLHAANPQNANVQPVHSYSQTSSQLYPRPRSKWSTHCKVYASKT